MNHAPTLQSPASEHPDPSGRERISDCLRRYPNISDEELTDLIRGFRQLSSLDVALMLSDPDIAPQLERFRADHKGDTRLPFRNYAALLAIGLLCLLCIVYALLVAT